MGISVWREKSSVGLPDFECSWPDRIAESASHTPASPQAVTYLSLQFNSGTQLCLTLCDPMDCSMPGFPVHHQISFPCRFYVCTWSITSVVSTSLWPYGLQPTRLLCPWASPGRNTIVGCHALPCPPPGDQTHVSCVSSIASRFFTHWATWEAL